MRIAKLQANYTIELRYTLFPLHPYIPDEGITIEALFKGREFDIKAVQQHLQHLAREEGLELTVRAMTYNSRLAQELGKWAETQPGGREIHNRLYHAYFVEGINLANIESLVRIAESLQLDGQQARTSLSNRDFQKVVDEDWQRCREIGVMAVPTYICDSRKLVGAQTYTALENLITSQKTGLQSL